MYQIVETTNDNKTILGKFNDYDDARNEYESKVTSFLDGVDEEPIGTYRDSTDFYFEYKDGDTYQLKIEEC